MSGMTTTITKLPPSTDLAERLRRNEHSARGTRAENTKRAITADSGVFSKWCVDNRRQNLPADPRTVADFVDAMAEIRKPTTVGRYVSSISTMHRDHDLDSPTKAKVVTDALKRMRRAKGTASTQAKKIGHAELKRLLDACGDDLRGFRDRALLRIAYDSMCRRSELVALTVADIEVDADGTAIATVRRSKGDQEGKGSKRRLEADTVRAVRDWLEVAKIDAGPIFRGIHRGGAVLSRAMSAAQVPRIYRRLATAAGVDPTGLSGHSIRIGAAVDQAEAGISPLLIQQAGGWKSPTMVSRYCEPADLKRGAVARVAKRQGRG